VYLATGTHQKQTDADRRVLLGPAHDRFECRQHDPRDAGNLIDLGVTSFGTPIRINRAVYESDLKILTGRIAHHYFAGFSGGRKAIAPGVSGFETITANHKLVMNRDGNGRHPAVFPGNLAGNPVHLDMLEIARAAKPSFCLNTVLNQRHEVTHVFSGDYLAAHQQGCEVVESLCRVPLGEPADLVVASCGGWPYDISFMQVVKTIIGAEQAVADGGVLVVLGQCERGLESGFLDWFDYSSLDDLNRDVLAKYNLKGHNTYWIKSIQSRIRIGLVSDLPAGDVERMGFLPAANAQAGIDAATRMLGRSPSVLAIPCGNLTVCS
jgi:nickel-dependent lactate racemase